MTEPVAPAMPQASVLGGRPGSRADGLIEVYHELVARLRVRRLHSQVGCGWYYSQFSVTAGRGAYRWKVNELLKAADIGYSLAGTGEDTGRLVAIYDDGRSGLIDNTSPTGTQE